MRWESPTERFDMDATGKGLDKYDDEHYKQWPFPITEQEIKEQDYLKSLTSREELSIFLSMRGACLSEAGRLSEVTDSFAAACRLAPNWKGNRIMLAQAQELELRQRQGSSHALASLPPDPNPLQQIQNPTRSP